MTDLATLSDVAVALGLPTVDPTDLRLIHALSAASDVVRIYTGQTFDLVEDDTVHLDGTGTQSLQLPQLLVYEVSDIKTLDDYDADRTPTTLRTRMTQTSGLLYRIDDTWPIGYRNIEVTYTHGYLFPGQTYSGLLPVEPLPALVRENTAAIAGTLYSFTTEGVIDAEEIGYGRYSVNYAVGSTADSPFAPNLEALEHFRVIDAA